MRAFPESGHGKALPDPSESLDTALAPRPVMPGYVARKEDVVLGATLPPRFIDRCRQAYLRIPHDPSLGPRQIGVTSALYGEGKTSIAIGIATAIAADTLEPTVLLECDLERASLNRHYGFTSQPGLTEWLDGEARLRILRAAPLPNLYLIPAGSPPADPARVFYQLSESRLVNALQPRFTNIVIDLPPVLDIAYGSLASKLAERIVLVARYGVTLLDDLEKVSFLLGRERLSGIVLNGTEYRTPGWLRRLL
jgi:Mrp family chromosome partitioning ATPase